jgi:hypothetical protein
MAGRCLSAVPRSCGSSVRIVTKLQNFCRVRVNPHVKEHQAAARLVHSTACNLNLWEHYTKLKQAVEGTKVIGVIVEGYVLICMNRNMSSAIYFRSLSE